MISQRGVLEDEGALAQPVVLGHAVDQDFLGGSGGLVFGEEGIAQFVVLIALFPAKQSEGAGEAVAEMVLGGGGATLGGDGTGGALGVLLVGGDLRRKNAKRRKRLWRPSGVKEMQNADS